LEIFLIYLLLFIIKINNFKLDLLITNVFIIFLSNSFFSPILVYVDFYYIYLLIKRRFFSTGLTQREMNLLFENPVMDISYKYSYIFRTILTSFFFVTLLPIGTVISFFGIIFSYIIDKVNDFKFDKKIFANYFNFYLLYFIQ